MSDFLLPRIGIGYDIHRLAAGDGIVLAGVPIPCAFRLVAHSDGDVVLHALCDAILGALAQGDLGEHFPDNDERFAGCDSSYFIHRVLALDAMQPYAIGNLDCNIIAQAPRLSTHKATMREHLAQLFECPLGCVSIKARTNEGCDAVGEQRAIQCQAVVLLQPR